MEQMRSFDLLKTDKISVIRPSFVKMVYQISDGQFTYGLIDGPANFIGTKDNSWTFKKDKLWNGKYKKVLIFNSNGQNTGSITVDSGTKDIVLEMKNGFKAFFVNENSFFFLTNKYVWRNVQYGDMVAITESGWRIKKPYQVFVNYNLIKNVPEIPLMALYGVGFNINIRAHGQELPLGDY